MRHLFDKVFLYIVDHFWAQILCVLIFIILLTFVIFELSIITKGFGLGGIFYVESKELI